MSFLWYLCYPPIDLYYQHTPELDVSHSVAVPYKDEAVPVLN
jgi:hypothetical protein